ncbi:MAG: CDP-alcohol phosphatidyltransferase family protein [bacterium]
MQPKQEAILKFAEIKYISNILSISRIVLLLPIIYFLQRQTQFGDALALVTIFIAVATDFLDGHLARKLNQRSDLGRILDPLADKIGVITFAFILIALRALPVWYVVLIAARDLAILLMGLFFVFKLKIVVESNKIGKVTVVGLAVVLLSFMLRLEAVKWPFLWISVGMITVSSLSYLWSAVKLLRTKSAERQMNKHWLSET